MNTTGLQIQDYISILREKAYQKTLKNEIIVGFDHDWRNVEEEAAKRKIKNLKNIQKKYGNLIKITYLWDINNLTGYKCSPTDCGTEIFWKLMNSRINLY